MTVRRLLPKVNHQPHLLLELIMQKFEQFSQIFTDRHLFPLSVDHPLQPFFYLNSLLLLFSRLEGQQRVVHRHNIFDLHVFFLSRKVKSPFLLNCIVVELCLEFLHDLSLSLGV